MDWHPYQRDPPENSLPFPPCKDTMRRWQSATQKRSSLELGDVGTLISVSGRQRCEKEISVVYKPLRLWWFVTAALTKTSLCLCGTSRRTLHTAGA